ncbi:MAG TPA: hypothetical protein VHY58_24970 [Streptosporangiaceae bacterium]|jgi:hypothetical protein|nr:hypothetical protein [Streptosporangiaceae bacterium]
MQRSIPVITAFSLVLLGAAPAVAATPARDITLPLPDTSPEPQYIVPTDTTWLGAAATSSASTTFDFSPFNGDPDTGATVRYPTAVRAELALSEYVLSVAAHLN